MKWNRLSLGLAAALLLAVSGCTPQGDTKPGQEALGAVSGELPNGWQAGDFVMAGFDRDSPGDLGYRVTMDEQQLARFAGLLQLESWQELEAPAQHGLNNCISVTDGAGRVVAVLEGGGLGAVIILDGPDMEGKLAYTAPAQVAEDATKLCSELRAQLEQSPAQREPEPLRQVSAGLLREAEPFGQAAGFSIYLRGQDGAFCSEWSYDGTHKTGEVIAARPGEAGYILGRYDTDRDQWGTLSPLGDGLICFNNYQELVFIDTESWQDTGLVLDFRTPPEPNCRISSVARDWSSGELIVLYQTSSYEVSPDGIVRPWLAYDNCEMGAQDAHMEFQLFDSQGRFLRRVVTGLEPRGLNDVADCLPNRYRDGKVTFLHKDYLAMLVTYDLATGETTVLNCHSALLTNDVELIYHWDYQENNPNGIFRYQWYELGEEVAALTLEEGADSLTMALEFMPEPLQLVSIDPENRTAVLTHRGLFFHKLNFNAGTAVLDYTYPQEELGEPVLASQDGRYQLYRLSAFSVAEMSSEEIVAKDTQTGEFVRLGMLGNTELMTVTGQYQLIAFDPGQLKACSLADGEWRCPLPAYAADAEDSIRRRVLHVLYDAENEWILVLSADQFDPFGPDFTSEMAGTMRLEVYQEDWTLVRAIDTGITPPYSLKTYGAYSPKVRLKQPGQLWLDDSAVVDYLD